MSNTVLQFRVGIVYWFFMKVIVFLVKSSADIVLKQHFINPETKQFSGTGGGTYSFVDGEYTGHILFFSRDNSRVGAQLTFDGKLQEGNWHHSGLSSKGDPIYEVWGRVY